MPEQRSSITNDKLYELVNSTRLELKSDIVNAVSTVSQNQGRLEKKFDDLEAGRLTRAEGNITDLRVKLQSFEGKTGVKEATISTRIAIIWSIGGALFIVGSEALLNWLSRK